jgi:predicted transcriptional regulator
MYDNVIQVRNTVKTAVTIRLDETLDERLERMTVLSGKTRSEIVREALRRHLAGMQFEQLRERLMPFAEANGYLIDEDVFRELS